MRIHNYKVPWKSESLRFGRLPRFISARVKHRFSASNDASTTKHHEILMRWTVLHPWITQWCQIHQNSDSLSNTGIQTKQCVLTAQFAHATSYIARIEDGITFRTPPLSTCDSDTFPTHETDTPFSYLSGGVGDLFLQFFPTPIAQVAEPSDQGLHSVSLHDVFQLHVWQNQTLSLTLHFRKILNVTLHNGIRTENVI